MEDIIHANVYSYKEIIWPDFGNYQLGAEAREMVGSGWEGRPRGTPLQEMVLRSYLASPSSLVSWAFFGDALYRKPARSATMLRTVLEAPRGL